MEDDSEFVYQLESSRDAIASALEYWSGDDTDLEPWCDCCGAVNQLWKPRPIHIAVGRFDRCATVIGIVGAPVLMVSTKLLSGIAETLTPHVIGEVWEGVGGSARVSEYSSLYPIDETPIEGSPMDSNCRLCRRFIPGPAAHPFVRRENLRMPEYEAALTLRGDIVITESLKNHTDWTEYPDIIFERIEIRDLGLP